MKEFIKSIFTTPKNLWTLPQEVCFLAMLFVGIFIGALIFWGVASLVLKIKEKRWKKKQIKEYDKRKKENER